MAEALLGSKELDRKLNKLSKKSSKKALVAGIRAGMTPLVRAMRSAIKNSKASTELKREARRAIGARFGKTRKENVRVAKVGFGVGKRGAQLRTTYRAKAKKAGGKRGGKRGGVGISGANVHWFVLGTVERQKESTGQETGSIDDVFGDVTRKALSAATQSMVDAARRKITQVIEKEAAKAA